MAEENILDILRAASEFDGWQDKTPKELVAEALEDAEMDGLWWDAEQENDGCGCHADDLMPCGNPHIEECRMGVKKPCVWPHDWPVRCGETQPEWCGIGPREEAEREDS